MSSASGSHYQARRGLSPPRFAPCRAHHDEDLPYERSEFRSSQATANRWISIAQRMQPQTDRRSWCFFPRFNEVVAIPKVHWWGYRNSHMLRRVAL